MIEFKLPEVAEGVTSADISEIMVSEGDTVEEGQTVCEVETEKAVAPVECPHAGTIAKIHVATGDSVEVGAVLMSIEETAGASKEGASASTEPAKSESAKPAAEQLASEKAASAEPSPQPASAQGSAEPRFTLTDSNGKRPPAAAAPSVRRLAREMGIDLQDVPGSARGGRITKEDLEAYASGQTTGAATPAIHRGDLTTTATGSDVGLMAAPPLPDFTQFGSVSREKMNKLARTAATNLSYSWQTIPHVTQHDMVDITDLEASRKSFMAGAGKNGPKITMTAIMIKACCAALKQHPKFNSSLDLGSGEIVVKEYLHIGIAVDTEAGLVVPVIRDADQKTILDIAAELTEIAGRARDRKLSINEMQGGTFTITNLGGIGGSSFTPIVNHPEVAILGMSRGQKQLKLADGQPVERMMLPLSLSYDHRVINGADAARFITTLNRSLSDFMTLLVSA
ncbi:2-oxo acid dehydrogenase subunit E2 [Stratiformator vulcanicus]|uniref:Dihydrolipoamide acetyltransferase component of pyruvate dehydrogenase complex n=1 Tax=Stratiformator vulcanicus TaxID=2527980 RepID=A0A517QXH2_9PLAN|nr:2-oxo acid dehydrogenase subunit E2 [Stratiformator vulcanicus]QDT36349.1 Dihydrolipoyllysine-residue acetyltransferase component of pyruvate dehydrogenase complex [Stratiformator vulcanicus]